VSLLSGFLQTLGVRVFGVITTAVSGIIVARILGPEGKGILAILGTLTATIVQFGNLGLTSANVHFTARGREQIPRLAGISIWVALAAGGSLGILSLAAAVWWPKLLPGIPHTLLLLTVLSLPFLLGSQLYQNLLLGMEAVPAFNRIEFLRTWLWLATVLSLLMLRVLNVVSVVSASTIVAIIVFVLTLRSVSVRSSLSWRFHPGTFRVAISYGIIFFLNNALAFLLLKSDFFLVNYFLGTGGVGVYSIAVQLADLLLLAPATLATLLFPRLTAVKDPAERAAMCVQFARLAAAGMAASCLLAGCFSPTLIDLLFGVPFYAAWKPFVILLPGIWLLSVENVLIMQLAAKRLPFQIPLLWLVALVVNAGLNFLLIPRFGLPAAAMTSTLGYSIVAVGVFFLFRQEMDVGMAEIIVPRREDWLSAIQQFRALRGEGTRVHLE
jgi:O-antigen/teichoic acid export membrane protein